MSIIENATKIEYPDSDGLPMAENTLQFQWIVAITENLRWLFASRSDVFIAGDLLWYPVEGNNKLRTAPDSLVVFGRPPGHRGSYMQWLEDGIAPQVVFEVLSPGNRIGEMTRKFAFYEKYGVEEYYLIDPDRLELDGWIRSGDRLLPIENIQGWISPRLGIRFELSEEEITLYHPDGSHFRTYQEVTKELEQAQQLAEEAQRYAQQAQQEAQQAQQEAEAARQQADLERTRAELERVRAEKLAERLRQLGEDPT